MCCLSCSDVLALPIFKQEESSLPPENENKILPFQYVLCAATSPAVKLHDETLTYLNQGGNCLLMLPYRPCVCPVGKGKQLPAAALQWGSCSSRLLQIPATSVALQQVLHSSGGWH